MYRLSLPLCVLLSARELRGRIYLTPRGSRDEAEHNIIQ